MNSVIHQSDSQIKVLILDVVFFARSVLASAHLDNTHNRFHMHADYFAENFFRKYSHFFVLGAVFEK